MKFIPNAVIAAATLFGALVNYKTLVENVRIR
jgi:hypothetical protein